MEKIINTELKTVACWLSANKLSLNISKPSFLIFHPPQKAVKKINLKIYDNSIPEKANTKYLGVIIDKHLTWKDHIHQLNIKLNRSLGILSKLKHNLPQTLIKTICYAFFKPHVDYCNTTWSCTSTTNLEPINISMKKAVRIMTYSPPDAHSTLLFKALHLLLDFKDTRCLHLGKLMWDIQNNVLPIHLISTLTIDKVSKS